MTNNLRQKELLTSVLCTLYTNTKDVKTNKKASFGDVFEKIKNGTYQSQISKLRSFEYDSNEQKEYKKCNLPAFSIYGDCTPTRSIANFAPSTYTNLIHIDIDLQDNKGVDMPALRAKIIDLPFVFACFTSPRGTGLKALFLHNLGYEFHKEAFEYFERYFKVAYNVVIDTQCKNIDRICYVSFDTDLYLNEKCYPYKINLDTIKEASKPTPNYKIQSQNVYDFCVKCVEKTCSFVQGSKSKFRLLLAKYLSVYQVPKSQIEAYITQNFASSTGSVKTLYDIKSGLKYAEKEPKREWKEYEPKQTLPTQKPSKPKKETFEQVDKEITVFEKVINYLTTKHKIRFNNISKCIEVDSKEFSEKELKGLFVDIKLAIPKATEKDFFTYILSNKIEEYNPIFEFFEKNKHNQTGFIKALFDCIELENENERSSLFSFFQKWCVGIIAQILEDDGRNMLMPILIGQGFNYKSTFFNNLLPKEFMKFFCTNQLAEGNDSKALMCENILVLVDELAPATTKEGAKLRAFLSSSEYTYRQPYALKNTTNKRLASVCCTTNYRDVITEAENNRRLIPIKIKNIDIDKYLEVSKTAFIVECYNLYKNAADRFAWELKKDEAILLKDFSKNYENEDSELSLLLSYVQPSTPREEGASFATTTEIYNFIFSRNEKSELKIKLLGSLLQKAGSGFERVGVRIEGQVRYGYWIRVL